MGLQGAVMFNAATEQIQQSAKNLQALQDARKKRKQEDEMFDINKKKAELGLKEAELKGETTSIQNQTQRALLNEYFKQQGMINDGKNAEIDQVEHQQTQALGQAKDVAGTILKTDPVVQSMVAQHINPALTTVPGPNDGMVQGQDASYDNTPNAVPSAFSSVPDNPLQSSLNANGKFGLKNQKRGEFISDRIRKLKEAGTPLLPQEQQFDYLNTLKDQGMRYNRGAVLRQAKELAKGEQGDKFVTLKQIKDKIPDAESELYGLSFQDHVGAAPEEKPKTTPEEDAQRVLAEGKKADLGNIDSYTAGETRDVPGKGKYKYLGNNKWQKL